MWIIVGVEGPSPLYRPKTVARFQGLLFRNENTPLLNGVHCLQFDPFGPNITEKGYARIKLDGPAMYAHRAAMAMHLSRRLTQDEVVMHLCDNPLCCEPLHLKLGTNLENTLDRTTKGRTRTGPRKCLTAEKVGQIKVAMQIPGVTTAEIKRRFPAVTEHVLYMIRTERSWGHVQIAPHPRKVNAA